MIPFTETRNYVKNILRNYFFYNYDPASPDALRSTCDLNLTDFRVYMIR